MQRPINAMRLGALLFALLPVHAPQASTYSVGTGSGCTFTSIQSALNAAAANPMGPHTIRLPAGTYAVPDGLRYLNGQTNLTIDGGYASCTATAPTAGLRSVLNAAGGADRTVLDMRNATSNPQRTVTLRALDITGGTGETDVFSRSEGAGLEIHGNLRVILDNGTRVFANAEADLGGGAALRGESGFAELVIRGNSTIEDNLANLDGGGIWCENGGRVSVFDGSIRSNGAGRDGGGIWLGNACSLLAHSAYFILNDAGLTQVGRGGAIFFRSNTQNQIPYSIQIGSDFGWLPTYFIGNRTQSAITNGSTGRGGGAVYLEGSGAERHPMLIRDAQFIDNESIGAGGADLSVNRAISLTVTSTAQRCDGILGAGLCGVFRGATVGPVFIDDLDATEAAVAPIVRISNVRFTDNHTSSLITQRVANGIGTGLSVSQSVFDTNTNLRTVVDASASFIFAYNTVVRNSTLGAGPLLSITANTGAHQANLRGSAIWQPGKRAWGAALSGSATASASHGGCLLANDPTDIANTSAVRTSDPLLAADFTPSASSPALDVCNASSSASSRDAYGQPRPIDFPGIINVLGAFDLGAVERQPQ